MSDQRTYEDLPKVPHGRCSCSRGKRFYVAMSKELNERVWQNGAGGLQLYVFKIGSAQACWDRIRSLNQFRPKLPDAAGHFEEPAYAGCRDWKILKCWDVDIDSYDDQVFKKWLRRCSYSADVRSAGWRTFQRVDGLDPTRRFKDLCMMSEDFAWKRLEVKPNDPLHEQMLAAVAEAVVLVGEEFVRNGIDGSTTG